jgi:aromatic ring-opening dioxygenase LigB subunit
VVVSPHTPRRRSFGVSTGTTLAGDLGQFGADAGFVLPGAADLADAIAAAAARRGLPVHRFEADDADHGATVPLVFVQRAGWRGPTVLLSLPHPSDDAGCRRLGEAVAAAAGGARIAFLASGDMSHRLRPGAPAGHDPHAPRFDAEVVAAVAAGDAARLAAIDPELRERAAEDVIESLLVAEGAAGGAVAGRRVLSYEGPYGVGYLIAMLVEEGGDAPVPVPELPPALKE